MRKRESKKKHRIIVWLKRLNKKQKIIICIVCFFIIAILSFLIWLFVSAFTTNTDLTLNTTYNLPSFNSLEEVPSFNYGSSAVVIDGIVAKKSEEEEKNSPTASTAKMILGLAVMKEKPFNLGEAGETITISQEMYDIYSWYIRNGGSNSKVSVGEEISEYDALMSVFLVSSNNMADSLAIWAFGSLENYKTYATNMLSEWGISHTTIGPDASGFNAETTSTASDLALIGHKVLENEVLKEIVGTKEFEVPVAGKLTNTNSILGRNRVSGVKTGYIGEVSGYCLVSGYLEENHIITTTLLGAQTRLASFNDSLDIVASMQNIVKETTIVTAGEEVGNYNSWWTGPVKIIADEDLVAIGWDGAETKTELEMSDEKGKLKILIGGTEYSVPVSAEHYNDNPSLGERLSHVFGWTRENDVTDNTKENSKNEEKTDTDIEEIQADKLDEEKKTNTQSITKASSENCTIKFGYLMLINPNFTVSTSFIDARKSELVSVSSLYGIREGNANNGDNLLDAEAAKHLNEMVKAYEADYPGHTFETRSCYRARGTKCGRLCAATGASDHHTGLTCDLIDPAYGTTLDTDYYDQHIDWQWLYKNSYKYGFIDRFPAEWAGGSMSESLNVDENGSTGLFETWHYRYVGIGPATEIATGKYNNGKYDSLEHYLKARGMILNLKAGTCD